MGRKRNSAIAYAACLVLAKSGYFALEGAGDLRP